MLARYSYVSLLERAVGDAESVLDVGCGSNSPLGRFARRPPYCLGVDLFEPFLAESKRKGIHDEYRLLDALDIGETFSARSFDVVLAADMLEHLDEEAGTSLLGLMERIARRRVIVLTPNGFLEQGEKAGNPFQQHRSGWSARDLRERGYSVRGVSGFRPLRGKNGSLRWRPARFWGALAELSEIIVYRRPEHAFHLLGVRDSEASS